MTPSLQPLTEKEPALHHINIQFNGKGFVYTTHDQRDATSIVVKPGDKVKWNNNHGNYSILFKGDTPFADIGAHGRSGSDTATLTVEARPGRYKYAVNVALPNGLVVDDPEIIVDDGGT